MVSLIFLRASIYFVSVTLVTDIFWFSVVLPSTFYCHLICCFRCFLFIFHFLSLLISLTLITELFHIRIVSGYWMFEWRLQLVYHILLLIGLLAEPYFRLICIAYAWYLFRLLSHISSSLPLFSHFISLRCLIRFIFDWFSSSIIYHWFSFHFDCLIETPYWAIWCLGYTPWWYYFMMLYFICFYQIISYITVLLYWYSPSYWIDVSSYTFSPRLL